MTLLNQPEGSAVGNEYNRPYAVAKKPLIKWAAQRLTIERMDDQSLLAKFRYD